ncbi:MAG: Ig-like domain-containing protein, partial [Planctomycetota bacterium]
MMLSGSQVEVSDQLLFDSASGLVSFDSDPEGSSVSLEDSIVYSLLGGRGYYTEQFYQFDEIGEFVSYSMQLSTEAFAELLIESENENFTASYTLTDQFGNELASGQTESGVAFLIVERAVKDRILQLDIQSRSEVLTKVKVSALKNAGFDQVTLDSNSPSSYAQPQILDSYSLPVGFGNESLLLFGQHIHQDGNTYEFELTEGVASDILFAPELNSVGFGSSIELELYDPNGDRVVKIINGGSLGRFSSKIDTGTRTNDGSAVADSEWRINDFVPRQSGKYKLKVTATRFSPFGGSNVARTLDYAVLISRGAAIESGANTGTQPTPRSLDVIKSAVGAVSAQGVNRYFGFDSNRNAIVELDFNSGEFVRVFAVLPASENKASGLALANSKLILGLGDKVFEFETLTGELVRELSLAGAEISSLAFFKDEIFVLDSNSGNEIIVLDYQTGEVNRRLVLDTIENSKLGDPLAIVADTSRFGVVFETNDSPRKSFATVDQATDKIDTLWDLNYESGDEIYSATLANSRLIIHGTSRGFRDVTSWELASGPNFVADGVFVAQREESGPIYDSISSIAATDNGADSYSFTATTGETIGVQVDTSSNDDPAFVLGVEILTPDLTRIELVEIGVVDSPTTIEYLANQSGKYIVRLFAINGPGNYSVSVVGSTPTLNEVSVIENSAVPRFRDSTITIGFSESLNLNSFDRFDVLLNGLPAQKLSATATNGDRFRFDFSNVLFDDGEYELSIAGNAFNGLSGSQNAVYRTSVTYDTIGPRVENTSIPNVLTGPLTNFTVDFNEDINPDSIESSFAIYVRGPAGNVQPLQKTVIGNRVEIVMDETSVAQPGQYRLIVDDIVEDLVRNRMDQNQDGQPFDGYEFLFQIENPELESSQLVAPSQVTTGQEFRLDWVDTNAGVIP